MIEDNIIKLCIIDDEQLIVQLLENFFAQQDRFDVVLATYNGINLLNYLESENTCLPDILLMDLKMPQRDGMELTDLIHQKYPEIKIIIISSYYNESSTGYMLKLGASAFLPKGIFPEDLMEVIEIVFNKGYYFSCEQVEVMKGQLKNNIPKPQISSVFNITEREEEILRLICQQYTAEEIAKKLFISKRTVEGHKNRILDKTGAKNTAGLVIFAVQNKIVELSKL